MNGSKKQLGDFPISLKAVIYFADWGRCARPFWWGQLFIAVLFLVNKR